MAHFRSLASPKRWTDAFSASQSALESRGQSSRLSLAIVDGPVHRGSQLDLTKSRAGRLVKYCGYTSVNSFRTQAAGRRLQKSGRMRKTRGSILVASRRRSGGGRFSIVVRGAGR
jgi:hypothetical protein